MTYGSDSWGQEAAALRSDVEHLRRVLSDGLERATNTLDRLQQAAERAGREEHDLRYRIGSVEEQILTVNRRVDSVENRHRRLESRFELAHFRAGVPAPPAPSPEQDQAR